MGWIWLAKAARYYDTTAKRFMSRDKALGFVDQSISATGNMTDRIAALVADNQLAPSDWFSSMQNEIKGEYIRQYVLGRGGREQMTQADWGRVGGMLSEQSGYLRRFEREIAEGGLTEGQIAMRSRMYINSAREGFERGHAVAIGVPVNQLPTFPGSGSTPCLTNCKCTWIYNPVRDVEGVIIAWECTWMIESSNPCSGCEANAIAYNPLIIRL